MRKTILILAFILISSISSVKIANAVPAAPSPFCEIVADVLDVKKVKRKFDLNILEIFKGYYNFDLNVIEISTSIQEGGMTCDNSYIDLIKQSGGAMLYSDDYNKNLTYIGQTYIGQKIKAQVHYGGDENFHGFFLLDVQILEDSNGPSKTKNNGTGEGIAGVEVILNRQIFRNYILPAVLGLIIGVSLLIYRKRKKAKDSLK